MRRTRAHRGISHHCVTSLLLAVLLLSISQSGAQAATVTVGASGCDYTTITAAIAGVSDGDIIVISDATHTEEGINITKSVTIRGAGASSTIVQAHAAAGSAGDRVFYVGSGKTVTIEDMTIRHGYKERDDGGGIYNYGTLTVNRCILSDNEAREDMSSGGFGGGAYNQGTLTMNNCVISNNTAPSIGYGGGGIASAGATLVLTDCTIANNTAGDVGAGIECWGGGSATLLRCTVSGNSGFHTGGALLSCPATLTNCTISGNSATQYGGGLLCGSGAVTITNCSITGNTCTNHTGGIRTGSGALTIKNSIVAGNTNGGGVGDLQQVGSGSITTGGYNLIGDNTGQTGTFPAGTPNGNNDWVGTSASPLDPLLNALADNGGPTQTHALQAASPAVDKIPNGVNGMGVNPLDIDQRGRTRPYNTNGDMGAFEIAPVTYTVGASGRDFTIFAAALADSNVIDGDTITVSDAVHTEAGITVNKSVTIKGAGASSTIVQAHAAAGSAANRVFTVAAGKTVAIEDMTIRHGYANGADGGAIHNSGTLTISNCAITDSESRYSGGPGGEGGGVYNGGMLTMNGCVVSSNTASIAGYGGGVFNKPGNTIVLTDCTIANNTASVDAGGVFDNGGNVTLRRCTLSGNNGQYNGAAFFGGTVSLVNCTISGNSAVNYAGGVHCDGGTTTLTNCTLTANTSTNRAGGITVTGGAITLKNSIVASNTNGGGAGDMQLCGGGSFTTSGYNLIGDNTGLTGTFPAGTPNGNNDWAGTSGSPIDPLLNALADNGGATHTHEPQATSPAIDKIPNGVNGMGASPLDEDQRGESRPYNTNGDIGACEYIPDAAPPTNLGPADWVDGSTHTTGQPTLTFTQSDPQGDTVRYRIQIDDSSNFASPVTDYTSAFAAAGASTFTVGQSVSGGTYTAAGPSQDLSPGDYYWRVCTSDSGATSAWTTANGGSVAFTVINKASILTSTVSAILDTTATCGGGIMDDGGSTVTARGVCWNEGGSPTTADAKTSDGTGTGSFTSNLTGLTASTTYYVRAYATNGAGTAYGTERTFTTIDKPVVTTAAVSAISNTSASCGGDVTADGGETVTTRGVCWNTTGSPTTTDSKTSDGTGTGAFTSSLTVLRASTPYYVRAYATNAAGTVYGVEKTFTTLGKPGVTTHAISGITASTATGGGHVTTDGGASVTARGICWNTTGSPTTAGSKTSDGTGSGAFTSSLTGLSPSTTYYVRAYATNSVGTSYGPQTTFASATPRPDLRVTVTPPPGLAAVDEELSFELSVQNMGSGGASSVVLRIPLPPNTEFIGVSRETPSTADSVPLNATVEDGVIVITLGSVSVSEELKLKLVLKAKVAGDITLQASLTSAEQSTPTTGQPENPITVGTGSSGGGGIFSPFSFCGATGLTTPLLTALGIVGLRRRYCR